MTERRQKKLTDNQEKVLVCLQSFQEDNGYPPTVREICTHTGIHSTSQVAYYLKQLEGAGYLERDKGVSRGIRVTRPLAYARGARPFTSQVSGGMLRVPVWGRIVAGEPLTVPGSDFAYMDEETTVEIPLSRLTRRESYPHLFAMEVEGDSMIDALISEGDTVILERGGEVFNGDMVAAWLTSNEQTTLKYFYLENKRVRLQPANPAYAPIYVEQPDEIEIQGRVIMVLRSL